MSGSRGKMARSNRATPTERVSCIAYALLFIPASVMSSAALSCEDNYMRYASRIQCHSFTHRTLICISFVLMQCMNMLTEWITDHTTILGSIDNGNPGTISERESYTSPFMMECELRLRWATIIIATLSGESYRCLLLAVVAGVMLHRASRVTLSTTVQIEYLHRSVLCTVMTSSLACALVQIMYVSSDYAFIIWFAVWLYTSNTLIVGYYMKWGTNLLYHGVTETHTSVV